MDEDRRVPLHDRTAEAAGERLARVETQIEGLKDDTRVMRSAIHGIHGEMQKFVNAEQQCVTSLKEISKQTEHLPEIAASVQAFNEIKPHLSELLQKEAHRKGAWMLVVGAGSAVAGIATILGVLITAIVLLIKGKLIF